MKPATVYARAVGAIALPGGWCLLSTVLYFRALTEAMGEVALAHRITAWLAYTLLGGLIVLECHWFVTLLRLLRAGGRASVYLARASDPDIIARRRQTRLQLAAVGLSTFATFAALEIVFRVANITPAPVAPEPFDESEAVDNALNRLGIREPWDTLAEDDPRFRLAFLGDSMTYAHSVDPRLGFCHLVEVSLREDKVRFPNGIVTINMGYPGTSPGWQRLKYVPLRDVLRPDVVVQVVYPNDLGIDLHTFLRGIHRIKDEGLWLGKRSYVLHYGEKQIRYWLAWNRTIDYFRGGRTDSERAKTWTRFTSDVRACKATIEAGGATYVLVLFPWLVRLDDYLLRDLHDKMRTFATELDVPYLDLFEAFAGHDAMSVRVSEANEHANAEGHRLAADRLVRFLREEVFSREGED